MIKLFMQCITVISDRYKNNKKYLIMLFTIRSNKQKLGTPSVHVGSRKKSAN